MTMVKIRKEKRKPLTPEVLGRIKELEIVVDSMYDDLSGDPGDHKLIERLGWIEKRILDLSGERALEVNEDFRR